MEFPPQGTLGSLPANTPTHPVSAHAPHRAHLTCCFLREAFVHTPKCKAGATRLHSHTSTLAYVSLLAAEHPSLPLDYAHPEGRDRAYALTVAHPTPASALAGGQAR